MLDFSTKEFVRSFHSSDIKDERYAEKTEVVLGRTITKQGRCTATTVVVDLWKVFDPSVKLYKFVYLGGVARQHPNDTEISLKTGLEAAEEKAFSNPDFKCIFPEILEVADVVALMNFYISCMPIEFIRTKEEKAIMEIEKSSL
jgi:hypothetical protein